MKLITNLGSDNLKGLVFSLAIPSMLSQLVSVFYSIVDRMYIGNIANIGELALAGVGVCGPIITMITSFSFLVGIGSSPLLSKTLGAKDEDKAKVIVANAFLLVSCIAVFIVILSFFLKDVMLWGFGASEAIYPYANDYFMVSLLGIGFSCVGTAMNQIIICQGFGKQGMISVITGALINIILDPIFIFYFNLGTSGAALATAISQFISCMIVLRFLFSNRAYIPITFGNYDIKIILYIIKMGLPYFLIVMFDNFMLIGLNSVIQHYGGSTNGDMLLTCNTILQSFMLVVTMPLGGLTTGTQTILGYNYGAKRPDKIKKAQAIIFKTGLVYCSIMFLISWFLPKYFVMIFVQDPIYIDMTVKIIRLSTIGIIPLAIQYEIVDGSFTGLSKIHIALFLSAFRKIVYFACIFILPLFLPIEYVFIAESISDIFPVIVSYITYKVMMQKMLKEIE